MKNKPFLLIFTIGIIFSSLLFSPFILDYTLVPRFIGLSVCLIIVLGLLIKQKQSLKFSLDLITTPYVTFTLFCCISVLWANTKSEALFDASKQVLSLITFLFAAFLFKTQKGFFLEKLLKFCVILFLISFSFGISQLLGLTSLSKESLYQITGINGHKNLYSSFMFLNFFFLLMAYHKLSSPWKTISLISIILTILFLCLLKTKAVGIATVVSSLIYFFFYFVFPKAKSKKIVVPSTSIILLVFICINFFFFFYLQTLIQKGIGPQTNTVASSLLKNETLKLEEERLVLWDKTYTLIQKHTIRGVGMGNWQIHLPDATLTGLWRGDELNYTFQRPHNDFLWLLSETGLIGFNLFLLFIISVFVLLIKTLKFIPDEKNIRIEIISCLACIGGYYALSFFDFPKERMEHNVWIALILALAYSLIKTYGSIKTFKSIYPDKMLHYLVLTVLFIVFLIGLKRFSGEYYTKLMFDAKNINDNLKIIAHGNSAQSLAFSVDPTSVPLSWYTGNAHAALGNYSQAKKDFIRAYRLAPYNRNVLNDLGSACVFTNEVLLAKKYFEEAARISPRFDEPKLNLASLYINAQDYKTAGDWLKTLKHDSERRSTYQRIVDLADKK